jgi:hypothetical protein
MVASGANGFASVKWDPTGTDCKFATHNLAHDFHPTYATSSEPTRVPGAAHSYNIAFSDEIGHFEYCNSVTKEFTPCTSVTGSDKKAGLDDLDCVDPGFPAAFGLLHIGGCIDADEDFDGVPYRKNVWPGTLTDPVQDALLHAEPVIFTSPLLTDATGRVSNFSRVAFETDLPRVEFGTTPPASGTCRTLRIRIRDRAASIRPRARPSIRSTARGWIAPVAGGRRVDRSSPGRWTISAVAQRRSLAPSWRISIPPRMVFHNSSSRTFTRHCR